MTTVWQPTRWFMQYRCNNNMSVGSVNISNSLDPAAWDAQLLSTAMADGLTLAEAHELYRCTIETTLDRSEEAPTVDELMITLLLLPATLQVLPMPQVTSASHIRRRDDRNR